MELVAYTIVTNSKGKQEIKSFPLNFEIQAHLLLNYLCDMVFFRHSEVYYTHFMDSKSLYIFVSWRDAYTSDMMHGELIATAEPGWQQHLRTLKGLIDMIIDEAASMGHSMFDDLFF